MDYIKPIDVVKAMVSAGDTKAGLPVKDLLIRGFLFVGLFLYWTYRPAPAAKPAEAPLTAGDAEPARA